MPLYILKGSKVVQTTQETIGRWKVFNVVKDRLDPRTFEKMVKTVYIALAKEKPSVKNKLVWTRCAKLIGYKSEAPTESTNHLWRHAFEKAKSDPKLCYQFVGSLVMWCIADLSDIWISSKTKDNSDDEHEYSQYWINNNFIPNQSKGDKVYASITDLTSKFDSNRL